jgi:hypothetical protein
MDRGDKVKFWITILFRFLLLFALGQAIWFGDWLDVFYAVLTLILISLPSIIEHRTKIDWPSEFEVMIVTFIFASIYLGEIHSFYARFWWWDELLHFISGLIIALIAFTLVWILNKESKVRMKLGPGFIALFTFCFALASGAVWEIIEFIIDIITKNAYAMQEDGILDTMTDLILDALGALIVSVMGYIYLKKKGLKKQRGRIVAFFELLEDRFLKLNEEWFKSGKSG